MKILKIEFENINSLKGAHCIDFTKEPFTTNSLFAITGPTGSGKSSILDVISLALFNHVPRLGKISKNEISTKGAILTRNQKNAMARITYSCKSGIYSSQWSIEINRNNNLNDYEMELHDHQAGKLLDLKKSFIPGKNEELIGLNYEQFIKAVLLAQGEFAQFLRAKKDERGELLEKITGTGVYRQLGIKAFEKNKEASLEIVEQQNKIKLINEKLLSKELQIEKSEALKKKNSSCEDWKKEITALENAIKLKDAIKSLEKELTTLRVSQERAEIQLKAFEEEKGQLLKLHEIVEPKAEMLREWSLNKSRLGEILEEKTKLTEQLSSNVRQIEQFLQQASQFTKVEIFQENVETDLNSFRQKVQDLQQERSHKLSNYSLKKEQLYTQLNETDIQVSEDLPDLRSKIKHSSMLVTSEIEQLISKYQIKEIEKVSEELEKLTVLQKRSRQAYRYFSRLQEISKELETILEKLKVLEPQLKTAPVKIDGLSRATELLKANLTNKKLELDFLKLKASYEEQRQKLVDGEPCPLCGSLHHPLGKEQAGNESALETEIKTLDRNYEDSLAKLTREQSNLANLDISYQEQLDRRETLQQEQRQEIANVTQEYPEFAELRTTAQFEQYENSLDEQMRELRKVEQAARSQKAYQSALPLLDELQEIIASGKSLKERIDQLYKGSSIQNDVQKLQNNWVKLLQERESTGNLLQIKQEQYAKLQVVQDKLTQNLNAFCQEKGFDSIESARKSLLAEGQASDFRKNKQAIIDLLTGSKASQQILLEQLEKLKKQDSDSDTSLLEQQLQQRNEQLQELELECKEIDRILKNHQENYDQKERLQNEISSREKQCKRWRILNELIGDSKGKKFNDFAQDLTLTKLLSLANVRLKELNDRYVIDKPEDQEDDGLVAIDLHMGRQRRSVKTLSGGETFILSLSMALALSDLASKNVDINSLFIDEGFGTLDPETLDQTLDTLERLQAESSKTIGIISHVDSLKERISTQIKLTRNGQGYSSLEIK